MTHEFRTHQITSPNLEDNPWYPAWLAAVQEGFHDERPSETLLKHQLEIEAAHRSTMRGVHDDSPREYALPSEQPVATFTEWDGSMNVGGATIDVLQISDVTVRASHRRRGLLRKLMTTSLSEAKERGLPLAALTVTEASIYGRFGFGAAVFEHHVELDVRHGFTVDAPISGTVEYIAIDALDRVSREVFDRFHVWQTGSIGRSDAILPVYSGRLDGKREPSTKVRAVGHWDDDGVLDGYVTWKSGDQRGQVKVIDFIACTDDAVLALWSFLGSLDLVESVSFRRARVDEQLPWAIGDRRRYRITHTDDLLWLRILDPAAALSARNYYRDGSIRLRVLDRMGLAAGTWDMVVRDGAAQLTPTLEQADVELDVRALASLLLGGVNVGALETAGLVHGASDAVDLLGILMGRRREPWCMTPF